MKCPKGQYWNPVSKRCQEKHDPWAIDTTANKKNYDPGFSPKTIDKTPKKVQEYHKKNSEKGLFKKGGSTPAWQRKEGKDPKGGLNSKGVASYRAANPGSKLKMAVTTKPSKLKAGSKDANRRKSFCARMSGMPGPAKKPNGEPTRKTLALRKWNC